LEQVKKIFIAGLISFFTLMITYGSSFSETFEKISDPVMASSDNRYAWAMCEFTPESNSQTFLYVGTKNKVFGETGEIHRMNLETEEWENVTPDFEQDNQGVRALIVYENESGKALYAGTVNRVTGCLVFRTFNGKDWEIVSLPKFGTCAFRSCDSIRAAAVIGGDLYFGTVNERKLIFEQPYLFRFREQKTDSGRIDKKLSWEAVIKPSDNLINDKQKAFGAMLEYTDKYGEKLTYAATWNQRDGVHLLVSETGDSGSWSIVMDDGFGDRTTAIFQMLEHNGYLYCCTGNGATGFKLYRSNNPTESDSWEKIGDDNFGIGTHAKYAWAMLKRSDNTLYLTTMIFNLFTAFAPNEQKGAYIFKSSDGLTWDQIVGPGSDTGAGFGDHENLGVRSVCEINGTVYFGTVANPFFPNFLVSHGYEIWKLVD